MGLFLNNPILFYPLRYGIILCAIQELNMNMKPMREVFEYYAKQLMRIRYQQPFYKYNHLFCILLYIFSNIE